MLSPQARLAGTELHLAGEGSRGGGGGVGGGLFRAKGFPWISPAGHILVLVPRFDREVVPSFQGHGSVGGKNSTRFEINFVFNEGLCLNK